jgi:hypothetical protein
MLASETTNKPSLVWQGSTLDNYTLRLTQVGLKRIIFQLPQQPGLKDFVKRNYQGDLQQAVARSIAQLARDALYAGSISQPNFSRKLRVFEAQNAAGRNYQILALPVSGTESAIIALRSHSAWEEAAEEEKSRRQIALGSTPSKSSRVGREVLQRWAKKGKAKWTGTPGKPDLRKTKDWRVYVEVKPGKRQWKPLNSKIHMGHKLAAVDYWQGGAKGYVSKHGQAKPKYSKRYKDFQKPGHQTGFKSPTAKKFMRHSPNYRFEWGPKNSSDGARMKKRYTKLPPSVSKWPK